MKIKRYKKVSRRLNFYNNNFGFRQPYQLLIDGTFCLAALKNQINIADNIPTYLQGELKLLTTQCALIEAEQLGPKVAGALVILKQYSLHKCGHEGKPIPASKCFQTMVGDTNEKHYIIATQDKDLQQNLRNIPGVPLLFLVSKAPVLDQPSTASKNYLQSKQCGISEEEKLKINQMKQDEGIAIDTDLPKKRKKKKGPNPLSCLKKKDVKKSKPTGNIGTKIVSNKPHKNRKRVRISQHVKDAIFNEVNKIANEGKRLVSSLK